MQTSNSVSVKPAKQDRPAEAPVGFAILLPAISPAALEGGILGLLLQYSGLSRQTKLNPPGRGNSRLEFSDRIGLQSLHLPAAAPCTVTFAARGVSLARACAMEIP